MRAHLERLLQSASAVLGGNKEKILADLSTAADSGDVRIFIDLVDREFAQFVPVLDETPFYSRDFKISAGNHNMIVEATWKLCKVLKVDPQGRYCELLFAGLQAAAVRKANNKYAFDGGVQPFEWYPFGSYLKRAMGWFNNTKLPSDPPALRPADQGETGQPLVKRRPVENHPPPPADWYRD